MISLSNPTRKVAFRLAGAVLLLVAVAAIGFLLGVYGMKMANLDDGLSQSRERITSLEEKFQNAEIRFHEEFLTFEAGLTELGSELEQLRQDVSRGIGALDTKLEELREPALPLRIAYINAEEAFSVFTEAVADLREKAMDKQKELLELQQQYLASTVSKEEYESRLIELEVELLQAQLNIDIGTIDRMIAAPGFADISNDLERLREEARPVIDMMRNLVSTVRVGVVDPQEVENRYSQVKNAFTQLDQLLTQAATAKIVQAAEKVAVENGYDLVLRTANVIVYRNTARLVSITEEVKRALSLLL